MSEPQQPETLWQRTKFRALGLFCQPVGLEVPQRNAGAFLACEDRDASNPEESSMDRETSGKHSAKREVAATVLLEFRLRGGRFDSTSPSGRLYRQRVRQGVLGLESDVDGVARWGILRCLSRPQFIDNLVERRPIRPGNLQLHIFGNGNSNAPRGMRVDHN